MQFFNGGILGELFKLPILAKHFSEHKVGEHPLGVIDFICLHYNPLQEADEDHERDMQLPFRQLDNSVFNFISILPATQNVSLLVSFLEIALLKSNFAQVDAIVSFNGEIWLPPKLSYSI